MEKRHRVLIAEDQHLLRSGLCRMVSELDDYCIVGEASGGPTVAAIGNAVAHALGARLRDLPLTRERVMAALLRA